MSEQLRPEAPKTYEVGDVVNGHRFTGTAWVALQTPKSRASTSKIVFGLIFMIIGVLLEIGAVGLLVRQGDALGFLMVSAFWAGIFWGGLVLYRSGSR